MLGKSHYDILEVPPDASPEDIRRAFRQAIARYHPDKVQHLGREFQQLAVQRSAELTEAYRTLMDTDKRAEYDRLLALERDRVEAASVPAPPGEERIRQEPSPPPPQTAGAGEQLKDAAPPPFAPFDAERANRDALIGRAALARLRNALAAEFGRCEAAGVPGFDVSCIVKPKLFGRSTTPLLVGTFVPRLDQAALSQAFAAAARAGLKAPNGVCAFLLAAQIGSRSEVAEMLAEYRRRRTPAPVCIVPIDVRDWQAVLGPEAPAGARAVIQRLQTGK